MQRPNFRAAAAYAAAQTSKWIAPVVAGVAASIVLGGVGFAIVSGANEVRPDVMGCYESAQPQGSTMLWWDVSMGWSASQERDIRAAVVRAWQTLPFNDRFAVITTNKATVGDLASGEIEICGPARSDADYARHGIDKPASSGFLANEADKRFREIVDPVIDGILAKTKATGALLALDSPLLEQMQAISRGPGFRDAGGRKRLILFTDGIQNTEIARFCDVKGDLPPSPASRKSGISPGGPAAMPGVEAPYLCCARPATAPRTAGGFLEGVFRGGGASRVDVYRLRPSGAD